MIAIIGALLILVVIILSILLICGLPLGELTMGGQHKVFPKKFRFLLVTQLILQIFFAIIILQAGGIMPLWFSHKTTKIICMVMASYLSLNVFVNFISKSKKRKMDYGTLLSIHRNLLLGCRFRNVIYLEHAILDYCFNSS